MAVRTDFTAQVIAAINNTGVTFTPGEVKSVPIGLGMELTIDFSSEDVIAPQTLIGFTTASKRNETEKEENQREAEIRGDLSEGSMIAIVLIATDSNREMARSPMNTHGDAYFTALPPLTYRIAAEDTLRYWP